ncbi:hypothetical protein Q4F19_04870 [Sphingomonas sp. BIUV-7]|uniref:PilZ domain-containing protein n=1 Tax=Sphingomonas natans TaxID=3063330 RepID=A0ABT8Y5W4_9SPHN|nr:hypothetical protein [Sphingomonas sp. BIUV-7]MDO6413709.1 hypothetical protein [Sphingomonas sp. BIUV-7]
MAFNALVREERETFSPVPQRRTRIAAQINGASDLVHPVVVHALSPDGVVIESHDAMPQGARVMIEIGDIGEQYATVVCRDGIFYDCTFERRLDPRQVHRKLQRTKIVWGEFGARSNLAPPVVHQPWTERERALFVDPEIEQWSARMRVLLLLVGGLICWVPPIALFFGWFSWIG